MRTNIKKNHRRSGTALLLVSGLLQSSIAAAKPPAAAPSAAPSGSAPAAEFPPVPAAEAPKSPSSANEQCSAAYERTQTEKLAGHYVAASAAALECSQLQCNAAIVQECVRFYGALEAETPTLVFSARKAEGGELVDVRVEIDGKLAAERLTGRPFTIDPGPHEFVFVDSQRGRMKLNETARVGDKARVIEVTFADPSAVAAAAGPRSRGPGGIPVASYVLGGVAVVAAGAFTYLRLSGVHDYNTYNANCSPTCNPDDVDAVRRKFTLSYVAAGVGGAALVGAAAIFFLTPKGDEGTPTVQASIAPRGDGAMAGLKATF